MNSVASTAFFFPPFVKQTTKASTTKTPTTNHHQQTKDTTCKKESEATRDIMSNVHGLFSGKKDDDDSSDDENTNNRFVGGIDSRGGGSGLAVEPNHDMGGGGGAGGGSGEGGGAVDSVFNLAEQAGNDDESSQVRRTITMYRDGFVVDDGPYRRLDDPANAEFLRSLAQGRTPAELMSEGDVTVGLIDKRKEEYVEQFQSFSGAGAALGSSAISGNTIDPTSLPEPTPVDSGRPSTSIQVRLPNGQRKVIKINLDCTVLQLAAHIGPILGGDSSSFQMVSGFPPKPLEDFDATVEAAGLKGAQVQIKKA